MKVLHVAAEVFPLIKTGGLADVVAALPVALAHQGADVRLLLPGMPAVMEAVQHARLVIDIGNCFGALRVRLLLATSTANSDPAPRSATVVYNVRPSGATTSPSGERSQSAAMSRALREARSSARIWKRSASKPGRFIAR